MRTPLVRCGHRQQADLYRQVRSDQSIGIQVNSPRIQLVTHTFVRHVCSGHALKAGPSRGISRGADAIGLRSRLSATRNRIVDILNGDFSSPEFRRNRKDDNNLKLLIYLSLGATSNCLDVGASIGKFLKDITRVAPNGNHIAYEPVPSFCERLRREYPNVEIRQRVLSNCDGKVNFVHVLDPGLRGYSRLARYQTEASFPSATRKESHSRHGTAR